MTPTRLLFALCSTHTPARKYPSIGISAGSAIVKIKLRTWKYVISVALSLCPPCRKPFITSFQSYSKSRAKGRKSQRIGHSSTQGCNKNTEKCQTYVIEVWRHISPTM